MKLKVNFDDDVILTSDIRENYIKENQSWYNLEYSDFVDICDKFYDRIVEGILNGKTFYMPSGLGKIEINKKRILKFGSGIRGVDWKTTKEVGKLVYHLNEHSDGFNYNINWFRGRTTKNLSTFSFIPTRTFKRSLAKLIKNRERDFFEIK